jgi:hypothetical protein
MIPRLLFLLIAVFWVVMNWLLWRVEYDSRGEGIRVPVNLVWQKILTAPDISSLNVFQGGERTGFCEFSTSVEQEMAALDESDGVPTKINSHAGYQIRFNGNVTLGDCTNRLTFNGQIEFSPQREWRELNLKLSAHATAIEIHSLAAEQTVHLTITSEGITNRQMFGFADLQNPNTIWSAFVGNLGEWATGLNLPIDSQAPSVLAQNIQWEAHLDRLMLGDESVLAYRLETRVFDHPIVVYISTLGEILRVELPGGVIASFDQLGNP